MDIMIYECDTVSVIANSGRRDLVKSLVSILAPCVASELIDEFVLSQAAQTYEQGAEHHSVCTKHTRECYRAISYT